MSTHNTSPPTFTAIVNDIQVSAEQQTKVTGVTLYTGRAEVTREVRVSVGTGQNRITIAGLSSSLDGTTLRVEGKGAGTIQGVTVSNAAQPPTVTTSSALEAIGEKQREIEAAIERCKRNRDAVYKYLETLDAQHVDAEKLSGIIQASEENLERLDRRMATLRRELDTSKEEVDEEKQRLNPPVNTQLRKQAEIGVFAARDGEVVLVLKYAVLGATWDATYDARVNTQTKEKSLKLIYQAKIKQSTGESWTDVPILLETNAPTFNICLPTLPIRRLEVLEKLNEGVEKSAKRRFLGGVHIQLSERSLGSRSRSARYEEEEVESDEDGFDGSDDEESTPAMAAIVASVHSKGAVSTTYKIPGLVTIPTDNKDHNITIVELELDAVLSWVAVPRQDARAHLQAKIENSSEYILLKGDVNIYVDGAFNSKSTLPMTNPQETFEFSLGIDPAIRITYHPCVEKSSQSGFVTKTLTKVSTQRITIQNTKLTPLNKLKIIDGVPVSKDARITVKLKTPELALPSRVNALQQTLSVTSSIKGGSNVNGAASDAGKKAESLPLPTKVSNEPLVVAQWHGADEDNVEVDVLGQDGKLSWLVTDLGSMKAANIALTWEVSAADGVEYTTNVTWGS